MRIVRRRFGKPFCAQCGKELLPVGRVNGYPCCQCRQCGLVVTAGGRQYHEPRKKGAKNSGGRGIRTGTFEENNQGEAKGILFPDHEDGQGTSCEPGQQ